MDNEAKENAREDMIRKYAQEFARNGYHIWARSSGFQQPIPINGYIPDIIAKRGTNITIVQIETYHSLGSERDIEQKEIFKNG